VIVGYENPCAFHSFPYTHKKPSPLIQLRWTVGSLRTSGHSRARG
jgi:hypothetical protein